MIDYMTLFTCDTLRTEVADAARLAFEAAFVSPAKRTNAIAFCADALAEQLRDNVEQLYNECGGVSRVLAQTEIDKGLEGTQSLFVQVACDLRVAEFALRTLTQPATPTTTTPHTTPTTPTTTPAASTTASTSTTSSSSSTNYCASLSQWDSFFGIDGNDTTPLDDSAADANDERWRVTLWPLLTAQSRVLASSALILLTALCSLRTNVVEVSC
jgi:hypothetical protein